MVVCPEDLAHRIRSFAYSREIGPDDQIFPINRKRAWQIVRLAGEKANLQKRVWPHLLRVTAMSLSGCDKLVIPMPYSFTWAIHQP